MITLEVRTDYFLAVLFLVIVGHFVVFEIIRYVKKIIKGKEENNGTKR